MSNLKKTAYAIIIFLAVFFSGLISALYVSAYFYDAAEKDWIQHYGLVNWSKGTHNEHLTYALHALSLKDIAEKKDYQAIYEKSCWLLLISIPKLNPEVYKGTPRESEEIKNYELFKQTANELIEKGYCPQDAKDIVESSYNFKL